MLQDEGFAGGGEFPLERNESQVYGDSVYDENRIQNQEDLMQDVNSFPGNLRNDLLEYIPQEKLDLFFPYLIRTIVEAQTIDLSGYNTVNVRLTDDSIDCIVVRLLEAQIYLRNVVLRHHRLTAAAVTRSLSALWMSSDNEIEILDLEGNDIDGECIEVLESWLSDPMCRLQTLNLSNNPIEQTCGCRIADALKANTSLNCLLLNNCNLTLRSLIDIITSIGENEMSNMQQLDISRPLLLNHKNDEICVHLTCSMLNTSYTFLQALSLKYCSIGDAGAILLAQTLMTNYSLTSLNLECNNIGVSGAEALSSYLIQRPRDSLTILRLSFNQLADEGAIAISEALKVNSTLSEITLKSNKIKERGLLAVGNSLYRNNSLRLLTIIGNIFNNNSSKLFGELIKDRFPYVDVSIDLRVYVTDNVHYVADKEINDN